MCIYCEKEIWRTSHCGDIYEVSSFGNVRRTVKYDKRTGKYVKDDNPPNMRLHKMSAGYLFFTIKCGEKFKPVSVHRTVAYAFIDKAENKNIINHKNMIRTDNRVCNLEWCDYSENKAHSIQNNPIHYKIVNCIDGFNPVSIEVCVYDENDIKIKEFGSIALSSKFFGKHSSTISKIFTGQLRNNTGYGLSKKGSCNIIKTTDPALYRKRKRND